MSRIFGRIHQIGYIVRDMDKALKHWTEVIGVGPFYLFPTIKLDYFRYHGEDSPVQFGAAFAYSGDLQVELISPQNDAPSMYRDFLAAGGEGMQHIAYRCDDYDADYARMLSLGYRLGQEGQAGGNPNGRFCYFETDLHGGSVVEITSAVPGSPKLAFYDMVRDASRNWDGKDPVRLV